MIKLENSLVLELIPQSIVSDDIITAAKVLDSRFSATVKAVNKINMYANLHELEDDILDHLLWESHITWAEGLELVKTREHKIEFIRNAITLHRLKGTPAALELVFSILEMSCDLKEWFEYDGNPYHFKVEIATDSLLSGEMQLLRKLILEYKNVRSHLEFIAVQLPQTQHIELECGQFHYPVYLPICGTFYCDGLPGKQQNETMEILSRNYKYPVHFPITGEIFTNEVMDEW